MSAIYKELLEVFGKDIQTDKVIEEMSELIQALIKYKHNDSEKVKLNVLEEVADVQIMLEQLKYILSLTKEDEYIIKHFRHKKMKRVAKVIEERKNAFAINSHSCLQDSD